MTYKTEQEMFWAGEFGDEYIGRNPVENDLAARTALFSRILARTNGVRSLVEFGANIGKNLRTIHHMFPGMGLSAIEINEKAVEELRKWGEAKVYHSSILDFSLDYPRDFSLVCGVLIHMNPDALPAVYDLLFEASSRYICVIEYYNPSPVEIPYRGHSGRLFKRDFAGEIMDRFPGVRLVDYGFVYHRDNNFPLDDLTWFLLEKK
ncbi:MAG: hypothetical protein M0022_05560 [Desulfobacteraceae bacterium]|nr:hypothetical protein [Desulfobacteraceae bacterium]